MLETLELLDRKLFLTLNSLHTGILDVVMYYSSQFWSFIPLFLYWFYEIYKKFPVKKIIAIVLFITLIIALTDQTSTQVKHAVKRYRPTHNLEIKDSVHTVNNYQGGKYGFFSGHATNCIGVATFLFLLFNDKSKSFRFHFYAWAIFVSYTRIYLGVHYPSDIAVGVLVGVFWGYIVYYLFSR